MTPVQTIYANLALVLFNITNSRLDAYLIDLAIREKWAKVIKHGINFGAYAGTVALCVWLFKMHAWPAAVYALSAFACRQITFDIPLNWRRGLPWDYVSLDRPPRAIMDRIEIRLFGYDGRKPAIVYACWWIGFLIIQFIL